MQQRKSVSLAFELMNMQSSIDGVRLIIDQLDYDLIDPKEKRLARQSAAALLNLISARATDLLRLVHSPSNAEAFLTHYNQALPRQMDDDFSDVKFPISKIGSKSP